MRRWKALLPRNEEKAELAHSCEEMEIPVSRDEELASLQRLKTNVIPMSGCSMCATSHQPPAQPPWFEQERHSLFPSFMPKPPPRSPQPLPQPQRFRHAKPPPVFVERATPQPQRFQHAKPPPVFVERATSPTTSFCRVPSAFVEHAKPSPALGPAPKSQPPTTPAIGGGGTSERGCLPMRLQPAVIASPPYSPPPSLAESLARHGFPMPPAVISSPPNSPPPSLAESLAQGVSYYSSPAVFGQSNPAASGQSNPAASGWMQVVGPQAARGEGHAQLHGRHGMGFYMDESDEGPATGGIAKLEGPRSQPGTGG